jgi:hypothetical protein
MNSDLQWPYLLQFAHSIGAFRQLLRPHVISGHYLQGQAYRQSEKFQPQSPKFLGVHVLKEYIQSCTIDDGSPLLSETPSALICPDF